MKQSEKIIIKWSKKERDYLAYYPDRAGKQVSGMIFRGFTLMEGEMEKVDWWKGFSQYCRDAGYDPETMKITISPSKAK